MNKAQKLWNAIRTNPKAVRFDDACKVAQQLGFVHSGGKGSHRAFVRTGEAMGLNFQEVGNGLIPPYQARQLATMIDKYGGES